MLDPGARPRVRPFLPVAFLFALIAAYIGGISIAPQARAAGGGYWHTTGRQILDLFKQNVAPVWVGEFGTTDVTASNASYDGALTPGTSTSFGFQAAYSGTNAAPTPTCTAA